MNVRGAFSLTFVPAWSGIGSGLLRYNFRFRIAIAAAIFEGWDLPAAVHLCET